MIRAVAASTAARAAARILQVIESTKDQTAKALRETENVSHPSAALGSRHWSSMLPGCSG